MENKLNDEFYDTSQPHLGVAIIFNHFKFNPCLKEKERHGSLKDTEDLRGVLELLGFSVKVFHDLTAQEIVEKLEKGKTFKVFQSKF